MMPIRILLLLLGLSYLLSASAIPATRTQNLNPQYSSALPFSTQLENGEMKEQVDMDEGLIESSRRMLQDYNGGTDAEANTVHDPKIPS
ncbi:hypothetical protein QN277_013500 [Acacia crassicarpa]|uniref:Uncharacterized protein n=1 Tax=Acacia crassicarpa TaxID=499986 RepID=A0AAE1TFP8_9FABA|nr:hypothetical protein QN277_013500 [Acacia crassicarpa]